MDRALIIFCKNPVRGRVKTRLAKGIGADAALEVYETLLEITRGVGAAAAETADVHVFYSDRIDAEQWPPAVSGFHVQEGRDLGERMDHAFRKMFRNGYRSVVIIGADCPYLTGRRIARAFRKLNDSDVVIGPAEDGGFYLLGMHQVSALRFGHIPWSTEQVLDRYTDNIAPLNLRVERLETLEDIDDAESWNRFQKYLKHNPL